MIQQFKHPEFNLVGTSNGEIYKITPQGLCLLPQYKAFNKYKQIGYSNKQYLSHRILWECFNGSVIPYKKIIHHIDGNEQNNHKDNLRCVTRSEHSLIHC